MDNQEILDDMDVDIIEEENPNEGIVISQPFSPSDIRLNNPPMNMGDLIDMIDAGWIKFDPEYQRSQNLWSQTIQSRLIESILLGLRLPAFYFEEISKKEWTIIDGLQRCCAIRNFCFGNNELTDLEFLGNEFNGKRYSDLDFETRRNIRMHPITVNLLMQGTPPAVKFILFKRLNSNGLPLNDQEIRNAIYSGPVIKVISDMAKLPEFINATQNKIESERKTNMDFVSRFVAFYYRGWTNYKPNLDMFINSTLEELNGSNDQDLFQRMMEDFRKSMELAMDLFGNRAFRKQEEINQKRRPLNKAYFEVISATFAGLNEAQRALLKENKDLLNINLCTAMRESMTYKNSFSGGTGSPSSVNIRYSWFNKIVDYTLNNKTIRINDNQIVAE